VSAVLVLILKLNWGEKKQRLIQILDIYDQRFSRPLAVVRDALTKAGRRYLLTPGDLTGKSLTYLKASMCPVPLSHYLEV